MDSVAVRQVRKRQLKPRMSYPVGCPSPKRQRGKEQQVGSGNVDQEYNDILILNINEFTIRQLNDVLKS
jgi:hypothetical protein